jgi:aspartate kinase
VEVIKEKQKSHDGVIVVLSALYGVTDYLVNTTKKSFSSDKDIMEIIEHIEKMHFDYIDLLSNKEVIENAKFILKDKVSLLEKFLYGIHYLKEVSPRSKDLIQSYGEKLSPVVLEAFLKNANLEVLSLDSESTGIICKGPFENALVDLEKTKNNLSQSVFPYLGKKVILLTGYYGIDDAGDVKTFGRGGTDYSAGFIANLFDAELEIWKDVSGFMSADPKIVPTAKQIPLLSYEEAEELGYLGAKILHPKTIAPLREKNLSAEIKNLFAPEVKGTIISSQKGKHLEVVKSIAATKEIGVITIKSSSMVNAVGFASAVFSILAKNNISINLITTSETSISISLDVKDIEKALFALGELTEQFVCDISSKTDLSMVGVVGEGLKESCGVAGRLFSALGNKGINIELISQGASEINISFLIQSKNLNLAIQTIHEEFITNGN